MRKNALITIIVIIVVVLLGWALLSGDNNPATETANTENRAESQTSTTATSTATTNELEKIRVDMTDQTFEPKSVNVKKGQTVRFVNQSNGGMWVASDPHPAHTIYPEFDEKSPSSRGGYYEFEFNRVGKWTYHNHLNPSVTGTIVVTE